MSDYEVVVGNLGSVYRGPDGNTAVQTYLGYLVDSKANVGRVAGEPVTLLKDGEPVRDYPGTLNDE